MIRSLYENGTWAPFTLDYIRIDQPTILRVKRSVISGIQRPVVTLFESKATLYDHLLTEESCIDNEMWRIEDSLSADELYGKEGSISYFVELLPQEEKTKLDLILKGEEFYGLKGFGCHFKYEVNWLGGIILS
ncbi:MAG: hypothetical protein J5736_03475 [Bacilli bacterium]|nr:hypothetical protein [Bacilli bacterium]